MLAALLNAIAVELFGRHHYRIKIKYIDKRDKTLFELTMTIGVTRRKHIDRFRFIKCEIGTVYDRCPQFRRHLCNGRMIVEPICYLGRWR